MNVNTGNERTLQVLMLGLILAIGTLAPLASSEQSDVWISEHSDSNGISTFLPQEDGREYLLGEGEISLFSASSYLKSEWAQEGYPGLILPF